jgi:hypothetical protein
MVADQNGSGARIFLLQSGKSGKNDEDFAVFSESVQPLPGRLLFAGNLMRPAQRVVIATNG